MTSTKRLYKSSDPMIAGVCGGIAEYFSIDPTLIRILTVVLVIVGFGLPLVLYIVGAVMIPKNPSEMSGIIDAEHEPFNAVAVEDASAGVSGEAGMDTGEAAGSSVVPDMQADAASEKRSHWSFAVVVGAFLICIGVLILLGNLVTVSFWRFWPVVFIVIGAIQLFTPSSKGWSLERAGGAILLMVIGMILLAWMLHIIPARSFLLCFINLWPMLLVVGGMYVIGSVKKISALNMTASLLLAITLLLGSWYYGVTDDSAFIRMPNGTVWNLRIPAPPRASLSSSDDLIELGRIDLGTTREMDLQLQGGGVSTLISAGEGNSIVIKNSTGLLYGAEFGFTNLTKDSVFMDFSQPVMGQGFSATLPRSVLWDAVQVTTGAADITLDFSGLEVRSIDIHTGVSACKLLLDEPLAGGSRLNVDAGMAAVRIDVPRDSAVLIFSTGLNMIDIDQRYFTYNPIIGAWCSNPYSNVFGDRLVTDGKVWVIEQNGVGTINIGVIEH